LVAQDQILEDKVVAGATGVNKDANEQIEKAQHRRGRISAGFLSRQKLDANRARSIWVRDPDRLLPPYSYYIGPLDPVLLAAGSCGLEMWTRRRANWLRPATAVALVAQALVLLPLTLPVLPEATMARSPLPGVRKDFADTVGWHDLIAQVAAVYDALPADERANAVILTDNYGEAGAIDAYGSPLGLPTAVSGELTYYYWKPAKLDGPVIAVGVDPSFLATLFHACSLVGTVSNSYGLHNEEFGAPISVCRQPKMPLDQLWPKLKAFQ
jgi:hypothetical protein